MSRSGYSDDLDNAELNLWRGAVDRAIYGKRGQSFLRELLQALDAMTEKKLIADELVTATGAVCGLGSVVVARGLDPYTIDYEDPGSVGAALGIARAMAAEIEYLNDEQGGYNETPAERWTRMRKWVVAQIKT